ncbi:uncharacterized protein LOC111614177 [Centruroides sculpturatus]|uniref:uncharacterized protein LOC111614177 n=1 Tax=Centruroides sculpturatus TaxID=218467 RepID=UPI000C6D6A2E|nr:uncharacterized protein LOC111614177 [Centruroides sculpturatus]
MGSSEKYEKTPKSLMASHPYFKSEFWQFNDESWNSSTPRVSACSFLMGICLIVMGSTTVYFFRDHLPVSDDPFHNHLRITGIIFLMFGILVIFCSVLVCILTCTCSKTVNNDEANISDSQMDAIFTTSGHLQKEISSSSDPLSECIINPGYLPDSLDVCPQQNTVTDSIFTYSESDSSYKTEYGFK